MAGRTARRRAFERELIGNSRLFDAEWYLENYPDVAAANVDPLRHYMDIGWRERRNPGPEFVTSAYLKANPDVEAAGANPLLHYVEFGYFEGRESAKRIVPPQRPAAVAANFGVAAPCISLPVPESPPMRWKRSCRLDRDRSDLFSAEGWAVGYCNGPTIHALLRTSFATLKKLSGQRRGRSPAKPPQLPGGTERLVDAWFVNGSQLRTRWEQQSYPFVVRGFQHDPLADSALALVGEAVVESPLDLVDLHLKNRLFPVLIIFAEIAGAISGARMLAFPSLCRGGLHFPELLAVAVATGEAPDPLSIGELFAARLLRLAKGVEEPAISRVEVHIRGADGRGPLFQSDVQLWLQEVIQIAVESAGRDEDSPVERYLLEAVRSGGKRRALDDAILTVGHDMVPTISALTEIYRSSAEPADETALPLIIASAEPTQPIFAVELPRARIPADPEGSRWVSHWPRLSRCSNRPLPSVAQPAAIALPARKALTEAELYLPRSTVVPAKTTERPAVSWVVETEGWPKETLAQAVHALSLQLGAAADRLIFVGPCDPLSSSVAHERFSGDVGTAPGLNAAVAKARTPLIGFIGAGILLHDNRSAAELAALLADETVATASCVIVRGNQTAIGGSRATVADERSLGAILMKGTGGKTYRSAAMHLWGTSYPVATPAPKLWLARTSSVNAWMRAAERADLGNAFHICSSLTTATNIAAESRSELPLFLPRAPHSRVTRVEALFG